MMMITHGGIFGIKNNVFSLHKVFIRSFDLKLTTLGVYGNPIQNIFKGD